MPVFLLRKMKYIKTFIRFCIIYYCMTRKNQEEEQIGKEELKNTYDTQLNKLSEKGKYAVNDTTVADGNELYTYFVSDFGENFWNKRMVLESKNNLKITLSASDGTETAEKTYDITPA